MNAPARRNACPRLSAPMATGDGLLARLIPTGATITLDTFAALCASAQAFGNGVIEITSRGSIQVRGLGAESTPAFAAAVEVLEIDCSDGIPVLISPLSDLDPAGTNVGDIAAALRDALAAAPFASRLAAKVSVAVDGGAALHLDSIPADIRLRAISGGQDFHVALGGDAAAAVPIGAVASNRAVESVLQLLGTLAGIAAQARVKHVLRDGGLPAFTRAVSDLLIAAPKPAERKPAQPIGTHELRSGNIAIGVGLPFGHSDAATLKNLIEAAKRIGASGVRTAPGRALLLLGLRPDSAQEFLAQAKSLGFIVDPADPRRAIIACAGAPICASGQFPARALAAQVAAAIPAASDNRRIIHISGCSKGCAHPATALIAAFGRDGVCDIVVDGKLSHTVPAESLPVTIADVMSRMESGRD